MYGTRANVNANCQNYVADMEFRGASINTLAWMTQVNICELDSPLFFFAIPQKILIDKIN
jgi:hypothetical protein